MHLDDLGAREELEALRVTDAVGRPDENQRSASARAEGPAAMASARRSNRKYFMAMTKWSIKNLGALLILIMDAQGCANYA